MRQMKKMIFFAILLIIIINTIVYKWYIPVFSDSHLARFLLFTLLCKIFKKYIYKNVDISWRASSDGTYVVVGASKGIGRACAQELLRLGGEVVLAARSTNLCNEAAKEVANSSAHVFEVDLSDRKSIDTFIHEVKVLKKKMKTLILNSGIFSSKFETIDGIEKTFYVNHLSFVYLVHGLLRELEDNAPSRIIIVASDLHRYAKRLRIEDYNFPDGYGEQRTYYHSKLCNILFARALAKNVDSSKVTVTCVHPGTPVMSKIKDHHFMGHHFFGWRYYFFWAMARTAVEGAQNLLFLALHPNIQSMHGKYIENLEVDEPSEIARDADNEKKLWDKSCELLGLPTKW